MFFRYSSGAPQARKFEIPFVDRELGGQVRVSFRSPQNGSHFTWSPLDPRSGRKMAPPAPIPGIMPPRERDRRTSQGRSWLPARSYPHSQVCRTAKNSSLNPDHPAGPILEQRNRSPSVLKQGGRRDVLITRPRQPALRTGTGPAGAPAGHGGFWRRPGSGSAGHVPATIGTTARSPPGIAARSFQSHNRNSG